MTKIKQKIRILNDKKLGGVRREYIEVNRKAKVGDLVWLSHMGRCIQVTEIESLAGIGDHSVLEPTDIIHIKGNRYRLDKRIAKVGEHIISLHENLFHDKGIVCGVIYKVEDIDYMPTSQGNDLWNVGVCFYDSNGASSALWSIEQYRVLELVEDAVFEKSEIDILETDFEKLFIKLDCLEARMNLIEGKVDVMSM